MSQEPCGYILVTMQCGQRVRGPAVRTPPMDIGAMIHEQLHHGDVPPLGRDVQGSVAKLVPSKVGVRAVLQQPAHAGGALRGVGSPTQDVTERRNTARDSVHVDAKAVQQFQGTEIAGSGSDVHRYAVRRIRSGFEQHLRKREVTDRAQRSPKGGSRKLAMPIPVVFGIGIGAPRQQRTRDRDKPGRALGRIVMQTSVTDVKKWLPILNSARWNRCSGMLPQSRLD